MSDSTGIALVALGWIVCSIFAYGLTLAFFQREYPTIAKAGFEGDRAIALIMATGGPFGLVISLLFSRGHGLVWRAPKVENKNES